MLLEEWKPGELVGKAVDGLDVALEEWVVGYETEGLEGVELWPETLDSLDV